MPREAWARLEVRDGGGAVRADRRLQRARSPPAAARRSRCSRTSARPGSRGSSRERSRARSPRGSAAGSAERGCSCSASSRGQAAGRRRSSRRAAPRAARRRASSARTRRASARGRRRAAARLRRARARDRAPDARGARATLGARGVARDGGGDRAALAEAPALSPVAPAARPTRIRASASPGARPRASGAWRAAVDGAAHGLPAASAHRVARELPEAERHPRADADPVATGRGPPRPPRTGARGPPSSTRCGRRSRGRAPPRSGPRRRAPTPTHGSTRAPGRRRSDTWRPKRTSDAEQAVSAAQSPARRCRGRARTGSAPARAG